MKLCVRIDPTIPSYMAVYVELIINKGIPDSFGEMKTDWSNPCKCDSVSCLDGGRNNQHVC